MTGLEAAAGAAAQSAGKALKSGAIETAALLEEAKGSPELHHAAQQRARRLAIRETLITKLFSPIGLLLGMRADYFDGPQFAEDLARKTAHLNDEEIVAPKASVAAQAMQGLGFSLDEPDLKEMYLNLLATASTKARAQQAHPAFAEIIRQLTAEEASALVSVLAPGFRPMCRVHQSTVGREGNTIAFNNYLDRKALGLHDVEPRQLAAWVDNWVRLGLIETGYDRHLTAEGAYDWIEGDLTYAEMTKGAAAFSEAHPEQPAIRVGHDRGILGPTAFGAQFRDAVMSFDSPASVRSQADDAGR